MSSERKHVHFWVPQAPPAEDYLLCGETIDANQNKTRTIGHITCRACLPLVDGFLSDKTDFHFHQTSFVGSIGEVNVCVECNALIVGDVARCGICERFKAARDNGPNWVSRAIVEFERG